MKFLVVLVVLLVAVAWVMRRGSRTGQGKATKDGKSSVPPPQAGAQDQPAKMLACSHCGVHLPQADAAFDVAGHAFCSSEHRVAGPR